MGGGGGKGGSSGDTETTIRYAPYLEEVHKALIDHGGHDEPNISFIDAFNATIDTTPWPAIVDPITGQNRVNPYGSYDPVIVDEGFFGVRTDDPTLLYEIKNFPSLWDMFGKFMGGLDVHDLWAQVYEDVVQGPEIENVITAHSALIQADIDTTVKPKFLAGMRDINSVHSTAFLIGLAIIQDEHVRQLNKFSSAIRLHSINVSVDLWKSHLDWDKAVTSTFNDLFKSYYAVRMDVDRANLEYLAKDEMWNINLFENARGLLGALGGGTATSGQNEPSQLAKSLSGVLGGASAGSAFGAPGAVVGGIIGLAASFM